MARWIGLLAAALIVVACSTKQIGTYATTSVMNVSPDIAVLVTGEKVDPQVLDELRRHLMAKLIVAGFNIKAVVEDGLKLEVDVQRFEPGNAALRLTVGFGAGRGSLLYTARYLDREGRILASMDGQERFTGGEPHFNTEYGHLTTLQGAEKVRTVLVQEAAKHVVELGLAKTKPKPKNRGKRSRRP